MSEESSKNGRPRLIGRVGSLDAFWPLMERILTDLAPKRMCEIGVDQGIFTDRLLAWGKAKGCEYIGIDPAPDPAVGNRVLAGTGRLMLGRSLEVLPTLGACEAYFIDGDHNHYTVLHELRAIAGAARSGDPSAGPVVFAHDVSWPWERRDMYHARDDLPAEVQHPASEELGVSLDGDDLVDGGLRSPGRYAIAESAGGAQNGVLTGIEDFLAGEDGEGWSLILLPMAFGLGVLYRPESVPERCRQRLDQLAAAVATMGEFLESAEANFLRLYLYAGEITAQADALRPIEGKYREFEATYRKLEGEYRGLAEHSEGLLAEYNKLLALYHELDGAFKAVGEERDALRKRAEGGVG